MLKRSVSSKFVVLLNMRKYLLTFLLVGFAISLVQAQTDSLRLEREGEKAYVIHKVIAKQTLFALANRYQTTVAAITAENPTVENGLQIGQTLKIPYGGVLESENIEAPALTYTTSTHTVAAGETLFSIAGIYNVSVGDIKTWNNLETNSISLDQKLEIRTPNESGEAQIDTESVEKTVEIGGEEEVINYEGTAFQQYEVEGIAEVIDEEEPSGKFFALHRTAKEGTVIKVTNLMNDLTVYVRVVGSIPDTSTNEDVIIKLNQRAYENLKALDKRFRVKISYFQ